MGSFNNMMYEDGFDDAEDYLNYLEDKYVNNTEDESYSENCSDDFENVESSIESKNVSKSPAFSEFNIDDFFAEPVLDDTLTQLKQSPQQEPNEQIIAHPERNELYLPLKITPFFIISRIDDTWENLALDGIGTFKLHSLSTVNSGFENFPIYNIYFRDSDIPIIIQHRIRNNESLKGYSYKHDYRFYNPENNTKLIKINNLVYLKTFITDSWTRESMVKYLYIMNREVIEFIAPDVDTFINYPGKDSASMYDYLEFLIQNFTPFNSDVINV